MKTVYIARHAEALPVGTAGIYHDFDRPLSPAGLTLLQQQAKAFQQLTPQLEACYASPLLRTQQTAQTLVAPWGLPVEAADCLGAAPDLSAVQQLLHQSPAQSLLLVTHQPFVVQLLSWLLTGERDLNTSFEPGTMTCLRLYQTQPVPDGELLWLMPAEIMAALAHS